jgi:threonyl-tRNA synthetase
MPEDKDILYHSSKNSKEDIMRHSCEHVMAMCLMKLYPNAKRGVGPSIENGFYQDIDLGNISLSENNLKSIEKEMNIIKKRKLEFIKIVKKIDDAIILEEKSGQKYKIEILKDLKKNGEKTVTYYQVGDYVDLCRGPHVSNSSLIGYFKLTKIAGAYWRGNEKNKMLTRIYGVCFPTKEQLEKYLWQQEEALKRDHKVLGKKLDLFLISDTIGKGLPLITPKGNIIRKAILDYEYELENKNGFLQVFTPHIARSELYKQTGHWQHYREVMYESFGIEGEEYVLKPMNCPHHYMIYQSQQRSYKDLPIRLSEPGTCYRYEKSGELSGLMRVRALSIDDAHILMREDQIEEEFGRCINMVDEMFRVFKLKDYYVRLSLSDPTDAVKYIADKKIWDEAKKKLEKIVIDNKLKYKTAMGEASFYGPKLDYMVRDSIGREWQMSTLQLDLFMAKRLNLVYTDENGNEKHPVILHRGLTGSIERTLAILIEHFAGVFPLWLSPVQTAIIPVTDRNLNFSEKIHKLFIDNNIRAHLDNRNETVGNKIRNATLQKIPYMIIIGDKEQQIFEENKTNIVVSLRKFDGSNPGQIDIQTLIKQLKEEIETKQ